MRMDEIPQETDCGVGREKYVHRTLEVAPVLQVDSPKPIKGN